MKRTILIGISLWMLVPFLLANSIIKPKDITGWNNLNWGMTTEEVQNILGKEVQERDQKNDDKDDMYSSLQLRNILIGQNKFRASLWMDIKTKKLVRIVFVPEGQPTKYEWAETFINLEKYLIEKYGDPDIEKTSNDPGTSAERIWIFYSTEIEMSYLKIQENELLLLVFSQKNIRGDSLKNNTD